MVIMHATFVTLETAKFKLQLFRWRSSNRDSGSRPTRRRRTRRQPRNDASRARAAAMPSSSTATVTCRWSSSVSACRCSATGTIFSTCSRSTRHWCWSARRAAARARSCRSTCLRRAGRAAVVWWPSRSRDE